MPKEAPGRKSRSRVPGSPPAAVGTPMMIQNSLYSPPPEIFLATPRRTILFYYNANAYQTPLISVFPFICPASACLLMCLYTNTYFSGSSGELQPQVPITDYENHLRLHSPNYQKVMADAEIHESKDLYRHLEKVVSIRECDPYHFDFFCFQS